MTFRCTEKVTAYFLATVVRGVGCGSGQISLTTPTNGMCGMWLIGKSVSTSSNRENFGAMVEIP